MVAIHLGLEIAELPRRPDALDPTVLENGDAG
jgi:hypothetical protein